MIVNLTGDATPQILLSTIEGDISILFAEQNGSWGRRAFLRNTFGIRDAIRSGHFEIVPPIYANILINGRRASVQEY